MNSNKLKVFEAFAGVGSQSMALRNIGANYEVVGTMDVDRYAILAYDSIHNKQVDVPKISKEEMLNEMQKRHICYNFSTGKSEMPRREEDIRRVYEAHIRNKNYGDISLVDVNELPDFDFFTYSFPCKNISIAGQQAGLEEGSGTQSSLLWECEKIIQYKKPKFLMMENVKNLISKKHKPFFDLWCKKLESMGYKNFWKVLNAKNYNLPQNRERVIMISILNYNSDFFDFPTEQPLVLELKDVLEDIPSDHKLWKFSYGNKGYDKLVRHKNKVIAREEGIPQYSSTIHAGYWKFGGRDQFYIRNKYNKIRALSPIETWRLIGFSDEDFYKAKNSGLSNSKLYERAGRGIAVTMLEEIFKIVFCDYIGG